MLKLNRKLLSTCLLSTLLIGGLSPLHALPNERIIEPVEPVVDSGGSISVWRKVSDG